MKLVVWPGLLLARLFTVVVLTAACAAGTSAVAAECYDVIVQRPNPFMGNHDEVFQLSDGSVWRVQYEYEYLYGYYPTATLCPGQGKLIIKGKALNVVHVAGGTGGAPTKAKPTGALTVVLARSGCGGYFIADGPRGYYLMEWYRGPSPSEGDVFAGDISGYGFKDVFYPKANRSGRVYVDDFLLSASSAAEKYAEKCQ